MNKLIIYENLEKLFYEDDNSHILLVQRLDDDTLAMTINGQVVYIRSDYVEHLINGLQTISS